MLLHMRLAKQTREGERASRVGIVSVCDSVYVCLKGRVFFMRCGSHRSQCSGAGANVVIALVTKA